MRCVSSVTIIGLIIFSCFIITKIGFFCFERRISYVKKFNFFVTVILIVIILIVIRLICDVV